MAAGSDVAKALRERGMRLTEPRRRVITALAGLEHATPDAIAEYVAADGGPPLPVSTIYRNLEALQDLGLVSHTHLDHRSPAYHLAEHAGHVHLVCLRCGAVSSAPDALAADLVRNLSEHAGFDADVTHMAIYGTCSSCRGTSA
jgi:Fur family ferric uptake transcriptional regulator